MRERCAFSGRNSSVFGLIGWLVCKPRGQDCQNGFLKIAKYKNSRSASERPKGAHSKKQPDHVPSLQTNKRMENNRGQSS
jgi:hypothetical protein